MKKLIKQIQNEIKKAKKIVIYGHIRPDGDCYGAQFGLKSIILNTYPSKKVYVASDKSEYVSFLGTPDLITEEIANNALSIVVDTGSENRISSTLYKKGIKVIKIDHHLANTHYGDIVYVDTNSPSTAQMIADYLFKTKSKISSEGVTALFTGIVTDTGGFKYRGVSRDTFEIAGKLVNLGADPSDINAILNTQTLSNLKIKAYVLNNLVTTKHFVYCIIQKNIYEELGVSSEEAASMVNQMAMIEGFLVWGLIIEYEDCSIRVRLRAHGIKINELAQQYNGGGHAYAAGASLQNFDEVSKFTQDVDTLVENTLNGK